MKEKQLVKLLIEKGYKISSAESLTGGMFASTIVNVPMASSVIEESVVTYSNEAKQKYAGVQAETIEKFGVVSEEVAGEMASGIVKNSKADVGVSFSGVAGPAGGTEKTPVGTVCFGFCVNGKTQTKRMIFSGSRQAVRKKSVNFAINSLLEILNENK